MAKIAFSHGLMQYFEGKLTSYKYNTFSSAKRISESLLVYVNFFIYKFKGFEAVQNFKYVSLKIIEVRKQYGDSATAANLNET